MQRADEQRAARELLSRISRQTADMIHARQLQNSRVCFVDTSAITRAHRRIMAAIGASQTEATIFALGGREFRIRRLAIAKWPVVAYCKST